jgi:hypothetical protein
MAQPGGIHGGGWLRIGRRFDNLNHRAIRGFDKDRLTVRGSVIDEEIEMFYVPAGEAVGIGRRDRNVFDSSDHMKGL